MEEIPRKNGEKKEIESEGQDFNQFLLFPKK